VKRDRAAFSVAQRGPGCARTRLCSEGHRMSPGGTGHKLQHRKSQLDIRKRSFHKRIRAPSSGGFWICGDLWTGQGPAQPALICLSVG